MRIEKKQITKDDGRYLVYYHFPEDATDQETQVFNAVEGTVEPVLTADRTPAGAVTASSAPDRKE